MATHSSILDWRIPWTEEPGGLQSVGLQRVGRDRGNWTRLHSRVESFREPEIIPSLYCVLLALGFSLMLVLNVYKWQATFRLADLEVLVGKKLSLGNQAGLSDVVSYSWQVLLPTGLGMKAACILALMGCLVTVIEPKIYTRCKLAKIFSRASLDNYRGFSLGNCEISPFLFPFCPLTLPWDVKGPSHTHFCLLPACPCSAPPATAVGCSPVLHDCSPELPSSSLPILSSLLESCMIDPSRERRKQLPLAGVARGRPDI